MKTVTVAASREKVSTCVRTDPSSEGTHGATGRSASVHPSAAATDTGCSGNLTAGTLPNQFYQSPCYTAYTGSLHRFNVLALAANAVFIGFHFVQTQVWYDGLAQDVHEATAQWSVIILLIAVLLMENKRRGLVFGAG